MSTTKSFDFLLPPPIFFFFTRSILQSYSLSTFLLLYPLIVNSPPFLPPRVFVLCAYRWTCIGTLGPYWKLGEISMDEPCGPVHKRHTQHALPISLSGVTIQTLRTKTYPLTKMMAVSIERSHFFNPPPPPSPGILPYTAHDGWTESKWKEDGIKTRGECKQLQCWMSTDRANKKYMRTVRLNASIFVKGYPSIIDGYFSVFPSSHQLSKRRGGGGGGWRANQSDQWAHTHTHTHDLLDRRRWLWRVRRQLELVDIFQGK